MWRVFVYEGVCVEGVFVYESVCVHVCVVCMRGRARVCIVCVWHVFVSMCVLVFVTWGLCMRVCVCA